MGSTARPILTAAALLLTVLAVALVRFDSPSLPATPTDPGDSTATPTQEAMTSDREAASDRARIGVSPRSEVVVSSPIPGPLVECRVMRGFDAEFPGARVRLEFFANRASSTTPEFAAVLTADDRGLVVSRLPRLNTVGSVRFTTEQDGHACRPATALALPGQDRLTGIKLYVFPVDRLVHGRVQDASGQPVQGARVMAFLNESVETGECGTFQLTVSSAYPQVRYSVCAPGYGVVRDSLTLGTEDPTRVVVTLQPGFEIGGRVTDPDGRPLIGARVATAHLGLAGHFVTSGQDGTYSITSAQPGRRRYSMTASHPGYAAKSLWVDGGGKRAQADFALARGATVEGRVVAPDGSPVQGAHVRVARITDVTTADGSFRLADLPSGAQTLEVDRPGFAPLQDEVVLTAGRTSAGHTLTLCEGGQVSGTVTDTEGNALGGIAVRPMVGRRYLEREATTNERGEFTIADLPEGADAVDLVGVGFVAIRRARIRVGQTDASFRMQRSVELHGRVVDAGTGRPIPAFRIRMLTTNPGISVTWVREGVQFRDDEGRWSTHRELIAPGTQFTLQAHAAGYAPCTVEGVEASHDMHAVVFELQPALGLQGRVLQQESGVPTPGLEVELVADALPVGDRDHPSSRQLTTTDPAGRFSFDGLADRDYRVVLRDNGRLLQIGAPVRAAPLGAERIVWLRPPTTLVGRLLDGDGEPLGAADIVLGRQRIAGVPSSDSPRTARSDGAGRFRFEGLQAGPYELTATAYSRAGASVVFHESIVISGEADAEITVRPAGRCRLQTEVRLPPGATNAIVQVVCTDGDPRAFRAAVQEGRVSLVGLPAGPCRIAVFYQSSGRRAVYNRPEPLMLHGRGWIRVRLDMRN